MLPSHAMQCQSLADAFSLIWAIIQLHVTRLVLCCFLAVVRVNLPFDFVAQHLIELCIFFNERYYTINLRMYQKDLNENTARPSP